jgi:aryl-alcohol dehydrogenase-like predicted oxidoreductase
MSPPTARLKAGETDIFKLDGTDICTLGLQSPLARGRLTRRWSDEPTTERAKTDTFARGLFERTAAIDSPASFLRISIL